MEDDRTMLSDSESDELFRSWEKEVPVTIHSGVPYIEKILMENMKGLKVREEDLEGLLKAFKLLINEINKDQDAVWRKHGDERIAIKGDTASEELYEKVSHGPVYVRRRLYIWSVDKEVEINGVVYLVGLSHEFY